MLKWSDANNKTKALAVVKALVKYLAGKRKIYSLDLLSGHFCPFADKCLSKAIMIDGKRRIQDGPNTEFRCFSASQEVLFPAVYNARKHNSDMLRAARSRKAMFGLLRQSMPENLGICRFHVAGDMFSPAYFQAWLDMAEAFPDRLFYGYTKSLPYWITHKKRVDSLPNFVLTASLGGRRDDLIGEYNLRSVKVILSEAEADNLPIDHDDSHAADPTQKNTDFALLIHGVQPKGTEAAKAVQALMGMGSYGSKK